MTTSILPDPVAEAARSWTGDRRSRCLACGEHFSTIANFDRHQPRPRRADGSCACLVPAEMTRQRQDGETEPVYTLTAKADGPVWIGYSRDPRYAEDVAA